jgi:hypothetical protein
MQGIRQISLPALRVLALREVGRRKMTRTELIIQLLKVAIGLAFGAYFVWWSLQVLDRLTPEYDAPTAVVARANFAPSRAGPDRCMYKEPRSGVG